jgi:hypothetical protein
MIVQEKTFVHHCGGWVIPTMPRWQFEVDDDHKSFRVTFFWEEPDPEPEFITVAVRDTLDLRLGDRIVDNQATVGYIRVERKNPKWTGK